ncbi:MAG: nitroreductase family protein [Candidatus Heimdallarchaeota archaeon]
MKFQESVFNIIRKRSSCRKYQNVPIKKQTLRILEHAIKKPLKGLFNNEIKYKLVKLPDEIPDSNKLTYRMVRGAKMFLVGVIPQATPETVIDYGYTFEQVILKATELDLGTCWLGQTFRNDYLAKVIELKNDEIIPAISPVGYPTNTTGIRDSIISLAIRSKRRKSWKHFFFQKDFFHTLSREAAGKFSETLEMVRWAPSSRNSQLWRIIKDEKMFHFYIETTEKITPTKFPKLKLLDIGIALCHFDLCVQEQNIKGSWQKIAEKENEKSHLKRYIISWIEK